MRSTFFKSSAPMSPAAAPGKRAREVEPHDANGLAGDRIVLNVGGQRFETAISTLRGSSTYFARMFSAEWDTVPAAAVGSAIFIDRDPDSFAALLSCMRCRAPVLPDDGSLCARLLHDAEFFGCDWLVDDLMRMARQRHTSRSGSPRRTTHSVARCAGDSSMPSMGLPSDQVPCSGVSSLPVPPPDPSAAHDAQIGSLEEARRRGLLPSASAAVAAAHRGVRQLIGSHEAADVLFCRRVGDGSGAPELVRRPVVGYVLLDWTEGDAADTSANRGRVEPLVPRFTDEPNVYDSAGSVRPLTSHWLDERIDPRTDPMIVPATQWMDESGCSTWSIVKPRLEYALVDLGTPDAHSSHDHSERLQKIELYASEGYRITQAFKSSDRQEVLMERRSLRTEGDQDFPLMD
jgi:hypothetical protein